MHIKSLGLALVALLLLPAAATAAPARPVVVTGGVANVAPDSAALNGAVNPRQAETTYFFQYGTTRLYGGQTPAASAGAGNARVRVAVPVGALAPDTRYHYRLVAQNAKGVRTGRDRTFTTRRQPLGVTLAATPNPITAGGAVTLGGVLTGTGNGGRQVELQANPYPYTQGFARVGNVQVTDGAGAFAFPLLSVGVNTQYRVLMPSRPDVVSPVVVLGAKVKVATRKSVRRWSRRGRVRLHGRITPAAHGAEVLIQKRRDGNWVTIRRTFARAASDAYSRYSKRFKQRRGGRYRVVANATGAHSPDIGRTVRVKRVRRR